VLLDEKNNVCVVCMFVCDSENAYCVDDVDEEDSEKNLGVSRCNQSFSIYTTTIS